MLKWLNLYNTPALTTKNRRMTNLQFLNLITQINIAFYIKRIS